MTIKIGESQYETRRPDDLDAAVITETGCSAVEVKRMLTGEPLAGFVARILALFLDSAPSVSELAAEISAAGTFAVAVDVAVLLDEPAAAAHVE